MDVISKFFAATLMIAVLSVSATVNATLMPADWKAADDNLITHDTDTGLKWLDLTMSINRSFNDVSTQLGVGGDFEGFRYATETELFTFWTNAGIPDIDNNIASFGSLANYLPIQLLQELVGLTLDRSLIIKRSLGIIDADYVSSFSGNTLKQVPYLEIDPDDNTGLAVLSGLFTSPQNSQGGVIFGPHGHWLVQSNAAAIPEPHILWLLGSGLLGLIGIAKRKNAYGA